MERSKVDEYLQHGIHGAMETKSSERLKFLTSLRERVIVALTEEQVKEKDVFPQVVALMKENASAHLFLNGHLDYQYLSKYIKIASAANLEFTIVTNKDYYSELGLVLAANTAINKEDIYIDSKMAINYELAEENDKGLFSGIKNLFK
ncbi:YueI family protein [Bacillus sp. DNRA2]|uniref:YueI family protein n=1 Tax=Bacillus sp. DNRA2 TaxID=2723053 RepID=UPI00145E0829|nr:YueI family protein [Bacillus sp. DNRA2]NMD69642.1 YueI family protein [Bacillus sp. DNRA2]